MEYCPWASYFAAAMKYIGLLCFIMDDLYFRTSELFMNHHFIPFTANIENLFATLVIIYCRYI